MNARTIAFELAMEGRQVDEVVASIFHTVLFHRSSGKFTYNNEESYSIRTVSYIDVDCDFIDLTYVCCESEALGRAVRREVSEFSELLRGADSARGSISLEFFQRRRARWPFQPECVPWEVWTVCCELNDASHATHATHAHHVHDTHDMHLVDMLQDKIVFITEIINRHEYVPKMPSRSDADLVFDTSYADIQPYLFKIHYNLSGAPSTSVGNTVRKLIRETLSL